MEFAKNKNWENESGYNGSAAQCDTSKLKTSKFDTMVERKSKHKNNTISSTKRVNHVTTFKNALKMFQVDRTEKTHTHIGTN